MARRRRDYAAEYRRRQQIARQQGFGSYYQRRIRRGKPASAPAPRGEELAEARGHAALAELEHLAAGARRVRLILRVVTGRDSEGRPTRIDLLVMLEQGRTVRLVLRPPTMPGPLGAYVRRLRKVRDRFPKGSQPWKTVDYIIRELSK